MIPAVAPGSYHINAMLDFPVSLGGYRFAKGPDDPIAVHMERFPHQSNSGLTAREQRRLGRYELLFTPFETIERNIRSQLAGMLAAGGFDPVRDIEGITVNRWAHGYAYWYNPLFDPVYDDDERYPHMRARKRFGRIAIANSDAGASAMFESAIEQAHRAATELT
jgi:spermidine dehydrogenase